MARAKQITDGDNNITITPKSKSSVYVYTGEGDFTFKLNVAYELNGRAIGGYDERYENFAVKKNNDLVITTMFTSQYSGKTKKVTTTIKNYFLSDNENHIVNYRYFTGVNKGWLIVPITPTTYTAGLNGLYKSGTDMVANDMNFLTGTTGADTYSLAENDPYSNYVYDYKGNDTYEAFGGSIQTLYDMAGDDKYFIDNDTIVYAFDYKGSDEYTAEDDNDRLYVKDYAGNDTYTLDEATFQVYDFKGNDKYYLTENAEGDDPNTGTFRNMVCDYTGSDTYNVDNTNQVYIFDNKGKDTYNISSNKVEIIDSGKGNDTYNVISASNANQEEFYIQDEKGNETYNLSNLAFANPTEAGDYSIRDNAGNDRYIFKSTENADLVQNLNIVDDAGKDKYTFVVEDETNDAVDVLGIIDKKGADTYTFKGIGNNAVTNLNISDNDTKSKDKYIFDLVTDFDIQDAGGNDKYTISKSDGSITDVKGNDKYTINTGAGFDMTIIDNAGKDNYVVDLTGAGSFVEVYDKGGKDSLVLSGGLTKDNIVFMADVRKDGNCNDDLLVYNKTHDSFMTISDFYKIDDNGDIAGFGDGRIETIKIGKAKMAALNRATYFDSMLESVEAYLSSDKFSDRSDAFSVYSILSGTDDDAKAQLVTYFSGAQA
ncbi:MAG: hypothetical protein K6E29_03925 [Cyanobacteria bacterium RUI128]|nr:hypothetical protein [Cyanobacteria bacterium RUI128]